MQNKLNGTTIDEKGDDSEKCVKLTKAVSNKSKEVTELKNENKSLKEKNIDLNKQVNDIFSKATAVEIKNTRLETQVENLIEALGKNCTKVRLPETSESSKESIDEDLETNSTKKSIKCKHNDKAICLRKESCLYMHNKFVCGSYSKLSKCEKEEACPRRHPSGVCNRWKRGVCDKDLECFYRHPQGEEGSETRKRSLSGQQTLQNNKSQKLTEENQSKQEDHFLFQKMMEMAQKYQNSEGKRLVKKDDILPAGWMNTRWSTVANPVPTYQVPQAASLVPPFIPQTPSQVPPFQPTFSPATPSGNQWLQQQPQQMVFQVPGVHPYQF